MPLFVQITDASGKVLSRVEGDADQRKQLDDQARQEVTKHIINRIFNSLPEDIVQPLTVSWGETDTCSGAQ